MSIEFQPISFLKLLLLFLSVGPTLARAHILSKFETGFYLAPFYSHVLNGSLASAPSTPVNPAEPMEMKYETGGPRFGLQAGGMIGRLVLGIDYSQGDFRYKYHGPNGETAPDRNITVSQASAFLMYRRFNVVPWIGYIFQGYGQDKSQKTTFEDIGGLQIGIGFKLFRWLQFNIEGRTYSFGKFKKDGVERTLPDDGRDRFKGSEFLMGLSFPFELSKASGGKE